MAHRKVPEQGVDLVARWEGLELRAYPDPATGGEPWTIGYGHTGGVKPGDVITMEQARAFLRQDLEIAASRVEERIGVVVNELTDNQYAALLSFVFNVGATASWTIWKRLKARNFDAVPVELMRFVNAGGRKMQGLVNRRADEVKVWSKNEPGSTTAEVPPSSRLRVEPTPPTSLAKKALIKSKTLWAGGTVAAGGAIQGAEQIQALAAPQAHNNEWIGRIAAIAAFVVVAGGIAIIVFKWLEQRAQHV